LLELVETEIKSFTGHYMLQLQTTVERHSPMLMIDDSLLPDPPLFSLLSTFNLSFTRRSHMSYKGFFCEGVSLEVLMPPLAEEEDPLEFVPGRGGPEAVSNISTQGQPLSF
jgi:hypothetical protein